MPPQTTSNSQSTASIAATNMFQTFIKKTARLSTRITASLGLISLTKDEEFEKHYQNFKHIEKTIKSFVKNLNSFVEHFENFLLALQNTSEHLSDFYRDKSHHQKELDELRRKNKALNCEHFHAFKRTIDRQVITVASQLLQKFSGPHQLIRKRSAKLIDFDTKTKEMESCRDLDKKPSLRDQYVIAKEIYERINRQLIDELPMFNQLALDIFRECVLVLLENRKNLIQSYTKQTASLLDTPLMLTYTASDVASSILMSCDLTKANSKVSTKSTDVINTSISEQSPDDKRDSAQTSGHDTRGNSGNDYETSRPHSSASQLSSDLDQIAISPREISSTPLSQVSEQKTIQKKQQNPVNSPAKPQSPPTNLKQSSPSMTEDRYDVPADAVDGNLEQVLGNMVNDNISEVNSPQQGNNSFLNEAILKLETSIKEQHSKKDDSGCAGDGNGSRKKKRKRKVQVYIASWPFVATGPNQLTITKGQMLKLIKEQDESGNSDWSLVQDKHRNFGYVPSSYIKKKDSS